MAPTPQTDKRIWRSTSGKVGGSHAAAMSGAMTIVAGAQTFVTDVKPAFIDAISYGCRVP